MANTMPKIPRRRRALPRHAETGLKLPRRRARRSVDWRNREPAGPGECAGEVGDRARSGARA
jgi:hypothetical protein